MHGHHISATNPNQLSLYYAVAAEKAAAAQRAADVRRKLLGQPVLLEEDEYRVSERDEDAPERQPRRAHAESASGEDDGDAEPVSVWA